MLEVKLEMWFCEKDRLETFFILFFTRGRFLKKFQVEGNCYKLIQRFRVTGLFACQYTTGYYGTFTDVILEDDNIPSIILRPDKYNKMFAKVVVSIGVFLV